WAKSDGSEESDPELKTVFLLSAVGLTVTFTLLRFALRSRVRSPPPPERRPLTLGALWPWPVAAALSIAAVLAIDLRGVRLNLIDAKVNLPAEHRNADEHEEQLRDELFQL